MSGAAPVALAVTAATVGVHLLIGVTAAGAVKAVKEYIDGKEFSFTKVAVAVTFHDNNYVPTNNSQFFIFVISET